MQIFINNKKQNCDKNNLLEFLDNIKIDLENVVIIYNEQIIKKNNLNEIILNENDKIEIVNFIDGG